MSRTMSWCLSAEVTSPQLPSTPAPLVYVILDAMHVANGQLMIKRSANSHAAALCIHFE